MKKRLRLKYRSLLFHLALLASITPSIAAPETDGMPGYPEYDEEAVIARINQLKNDVVPPKYNEVVRSYIITYTERRRERAQQILGRSVMYFPLFEDYLKKNNLPADLKYLPVVESALEPTATSRVGALGLWQFMPGTARWLGMEITEQFDERCDPNQSTVKALEYLGSLYNRFGDWELAIAAYNGGGGRVSRAMKRARSKDFWTIRRYLPRETSNYVPAFIAAYYLFHHYEDHDLIPEYPELDLQLTKTVKIYSQYSFFDIARITGLPLDIIESLNPAFRQNVIPENADGHYLTLPSRVMTAFEDYLKSTRPDPDADGPVVSAPVYVSRPAGRRNSDYIKSIHSVRAGDTIEKLAREANCTVHQIRAWNNLKSDDLHAGQQLTLYYPKEFKRFRSGRNLEDMIPFSTLLPAYVDQVAPIWVAEQKSFVTKGGYLYYRLKRAESVFELSDRLPGINTRDLMQLNGFKSPVQLIKPNAYVRIRKL